MFLLKVLDTCSGCGGELDSNHKVLELPNGELYGLDPQNDDCGLHKLIQMAGGIKNINKMSKEDSGDPNEPPITIEILHKHREYAEEWLADRLGCKVKRTDLYPMTKDEAARERYEQQREDEATQDF